MATALRDLPRAEGARAEVEAFLAANQRKSMLRFITCGSVDDGKSTLIGRLLYDSKLLFEDQLAALEVDSKKSGTQGEDLDFALLVDGLAAEREQGITIDVAYRFFATDKRKFIVADTPGHEQYTRNMVTGASTADLAVILIDARKGILTQTRRHSFLAKLLGIRQLVLAVNKMDLVGYDQKRFDAIVADYRAFADEAGIDRFTAIPLSGLDGDNVITRSSAMPWYDGPSLLEHLEAAPVAVRPEAAPFAMAVQWVNRPNSGFRGYAGRIASGVVRPGDLITILPSGQSAQVERIVTFGGDLDRAGAGQSMTLTLSQELDCSRGDLIVAAAAAPKLASDLDATVVWMAEEALVPGRSYWLKMGTQTLSATLSVNSVVDVNSMAEGRGHPLALNDIGRCGVRLDRPAPLIRYSESRELGGFILIDKITHATVAAGLVESVAEGPAPAATSSDEASRILWVSGASRAERTAYAARAQQELSARGQPSFVLDDAVLRSGLSSDLGDADADRAEYVRRAREASRLLSLAGVHVIVTIDVAPEEAHPGTRVDAAAAEPQAPGEWVI